MEFAEKLNDLLLEKGKSKIELSNEAEIPYTTICGWLKARRLPDFNAIKKLAKYFNVTTDYLLDCENDFGVKSNQTPIHVQYTQDEQLLIEAYRVMSPGKKKALFSMLDIDDNIIKKQGRNQ